MLVIGVNILPDFSDTESTIMYVGSSLIVNSGNFNWRTSRFSAQVGEGLFWVRPHITLPA
jgi:hypothetical protein